MSVALYLLSMGDICLCWCFSVQRYAAPEASMQRVDAALPREMDTDPVNLTEVMSNADDNIGSSMCGGYYCQML